MEIRYLPYHQIDKTQWDACLDEAVNGLPYGYSWYLDAVADRWDGLVINDYEAVFPLPWNRRFLGLAQVYQPYFIQQLGLFSRQTPPLEWFQQVLDAVPAHFQRVCLHLHEGHPPVGTSRPNMLLDLQPPYSQIWQGYRKSLRKRLRPAKEVHQLRENLLSPEALSAFYQEQMGAKTGLPASVFRRGETLMHAAIQEGKGRIVTATDSEDQVLAAGFFLFSHGRIINLFGTSNERGKQMDSMHFLLDALIEQGAGQAGYFDFEGSTIPGVAAFFSQFGPETVTYSQWERWGKIGRFLKRR